MTCCDSHVTPVCCDPMDCAPCCPACPTCPALHPEFLSWLTDAERRDLAYRAYSHAEAENDPRYWTLDDDTRGRPGPPRGAQSLPKQLRWARIAASLDPAHYRDLPEQHYRAAYPEQAT